MNPHFEQAVALHRSGKLQEAAVCYDRGLKAEPNNADACHLAGIVAFESDNLPKAVELFSRAVAIDPQDEIMWTNLGSALRKSHQWEKAVEALKHAIALNPMRAEAHVLAGFSYLGLERNREAEVAFSHALAVKPGWAEALEGKGLALRGLHRNQEALRCALDAVRLDPTRGGAHRLAGDVLQHERQFAEAEQHYLQALRLNPANADIHQNIGLLLRKMDRLEEAIAHHRRAHELLPDNANISISLSIALLKAGHIEEGWNLYQARMGLGREQVTVRPYAAPLLRSMDIEGKRLLVWTDQGLGEEIMFASLIPDLLARAPQLTVECQPRLVALFQRSFKGVEFFPRSHPPHPRFAGPFDAHVALPDTARWLRPTFNSFPRRPPYLVPDDSLSRKLRKSYRQEGRGSDTPFLIGISWKTVGTAPNSASKGIPLTLWSSLLQMPGIVFVNLQYGAYLDEIEAAARAFGIKILTNSRINAVSDLDGLAAQVAAMDAVVTASNTTAHMAGALGKPVWTLVPRGDGGLWHWFTERDDSPWYPSMRLVRQTTPGNWEGVVERAAAMVAERFALSPGA